VFLKNVQVLIILRMVHRLKKKLYQLKLKATFKSHPFKFKDWTQYSYLISKATTQVEMKMTN
jgi:hypothetical protein